MSRDLTEAELIAERAEARGMLYGEYKEWRDALRADYKRLTASPGRLAVTIIYGGMLFMLFDPLAKLEMGVTMCNREMTSEERVEYTRHPAAWRRRKPGSTIDDDEELLRRKRTQDLTREAIADSALGRIVSGVR